MADTTSRGRQLRFLKCASAPKANPTQRAYQILDFPYEFPLFGGVPIDADADPILSFVFVNLSEC